MSYLGLFVNEALFSKDFWCLAFYRYISLKGNNESVGQTFLLNAWTSVLMLCRNLAIIHKKSMYLDFHSKPRQQGTASIDGVHCSWSDI